MPEFEVESVTRRRKMLRSEGDTDDRGWTLLHIYARKGDLKEVGHIEFNFTLLFLNHLNC